MMMKEYFEKDWFDLSDISVELNSHEDFNVLRERERWRLSMMVVFISDHFLREGEGQIEPSVSCELFNVSLDWM